MCDFIEYERNKNIKQKENDEFWKDFIQEQEKLNKMRRYEDTK